jgi:hypothetical protein
MTDAWNKLGPAGKAGAITVASAVVGGVIVIARARMAAAVADGEDEPKETGSILDEVARILNEAAAQQDDSSSPPAQSPYTGGDVSGYERNQCLNPRGHATGDCTHERRRVANYSRGATKEEKEEEEESVEA